jgi:peptidyl-prolyl cis-trans isomerase D
MLNVMRENLRSLRWVLWAVAASMVLYLGAFFSCDDGGPAGVAGDWAARIDGAPISAERFRQAARGLDQQYRNAFGEQYESLRPSLRIGSQVVNTLIVDELVHRDAQRMGLTVGPEELAQSIRNDPQLQQDGVFVGREIYEQVLKQQYPGGVAAFERDTAAGLILQKWSDLMTQSVQVTDEELKRLHRKRTEKAAIDYVMIATADQEADTTVQDEDVRAWYESHRDDYLRDPGRTIRYIALNRDKIAETVGVTEDEIRASYEANKTNYEHAEQRRARHILLRVDPAASESEKSAVRTRAEDILSRVSGGEAFEPLAQTLSEDPVSAARGGDLDFFERGRMVPEFADAAFGTPVGEFAPLTETQFGFHVIQVTDSREAGTTPLEQVRDEIEARLKARRAQEKTAAEADRLAARLAGGEDFETLAASLGMEVQERFVTRGESLGDLGVRPDFLDQVFSLEPGNPSAPLDWRGGKLIVNVTQVTEAEVAPLEDVESQVRTDLLNERLREKAYEVAQRTANGDWELQRAAKLLGLEVQESGDLAPGTAPAGSGGSSEELERALFGDTATAGARGFARVPGGALLYEITRREPFDPVAFEAARPALFQEVEANRKAAVRESILTTLRDRHKVEINQALVAQIDGVR